MPRSVKVPSCIVDCLLLWGEVTAGIRTTLSVIAKARAWPKWQCVWCGLSDMTGADRVASVVDPRALQLFSMALRATRVRA